MTSNSISQKRNHKSQYLIRKMQPKIQGSSVTYHQFTKHLELILKEIQSNRNSYLILLMGLYTILKIPTASGRRKAFSTCASHFTFVVIGYGSCLFLYVKPQQTQAAEYNKIVSLLIFVLTPFLSPFIFTLRNDKVKEALRDGVKRCCQLIKD